MIALAWVAPVAAQAQVSGGPPVLTVERYLEDWSYLAEPDRRTGRWTEPFKYHPLGADPDVYLTTGLEARVRYEAYENADWGAAPDNDYVWHRLMPYADLHLGRVRAFAQPILSEISGADRPETPVDATGVDMLQAFVEAEMEIVGQTSLRVSAGRRLVSLGAGRLVDTRYGPNTPQAFDGVEATLTRGRSRLTALALEPVENRRGDFDDRTSNQKALWGLYATHWMDEDHRSGFDLYWLGFRDRNAVFDQGAGRQDLHVFGARLFGDDGAWRWNLETVVQRGDFDGGRVEAWGVGGEIARRFEEMPLKPEWALTADYISGDDDPDDDELGTFNPLFPRGRYFAAQSPVGPRNLIHFQPSVTLHPSEDVELSLMTVAYWRASTRDGLYNIPGVLVRSGQDSDARFIGTHMEVAVTWHATPELDLSGSLGAFEGGGFIRDTGPSDTLFLAGAAATFRF